MMKTRFAPAAQLGGAMIDTSQHKTHGLRLNLHGNRKTGSPNPRRPTVRPRILQTCASRNIPNRHLDIRFEGRIQFKPVSKILSSPLFAPTPEGKKRGILLFCFLVSYVFC